MKHYLWMFYSKSVAAESVPESYKQEQQGSSRNQNHGTSRLQGVNTRLLHSSDIYVLKRMDRRLSNAAYHCVFICFFLICLILGMYPAAAIEVYTPAEVFVENGTTGTLKCSFKSTEVISSQASVSWSFIPEGSPESTGVAIFYYSGGKAFPDNPQFKARVEWAGDLNKKDASIRVTQMQFMDNGTYSCDVKNPPDISGKPSLTKLRVVVKEALPQTSPAVIVGAVIGAIIGVIIIAFVAYLLIRLIQSNHDYEGCTSIESVSTQPARPGKKAESSTEGSRCSSPSAPVQGPVIYAQLDHSGSKSLNFHKMEPVVYADIRKN